MKVHFEIRVMGDHDGLRGTRVYPACNVRGSRRYGLTPVFEDVTCKRCQHTPYIDTNTWFSMFMDDMGVPSAKELFAQDLLEAQAARKMAEDINRIGGAA